MFLLRNKNYLSRKIAVTIFATTQSGKTLGDILNEFCIKIKLMIETMKSAIKILELAIKLLENEANEGQIKLKNLGLAPNVVKMSHLLIDDEHSKAMLSVSQHNPALILKSLALEQSFKIIILQQTGILARGHDFSSLFAKLPEAMRIAIKSDLNVSAEISENDFDQILAENSNVFITQRYLYEPTIHNLVNLKFLNSLFSSIQSRIE